MNCALCLTTLLAGVCLSWAATPEFQAKLISSLVTCLHEYKMNMKEVVTAFRTFKIPETQQVKCVAGCFFQRMGYVQNLTIDWDEVKAMNPQKYDTPDLVEKADQVVDACSKIVTETALDICELGLPALKCLMVESKKIDLPKFDIKIEQ